MDFRLGLVVLLCLLGLANGTEFFDCGSVVGHPSSLVIEGCPQIPCILKRGQSYSISVTFTSNVETANITALVHGLIDRIPVPFPITPDDGCKSGISCPMKKQQQYNYINRLPVKDVYPPIRVEVKWELFDDITKKDIFCIVFPVKIV